ncbi:MAG: DUF3343 domain-containing protein [Clostridia bacterium]|nr:DUF3343 domain-containing protein [Clostridia bacterium]
MSNLIVTVGSVTTAVRLEKQLNNAGDLNAVVIHTPPAINSGGCSYSVKTSARNLSFVKQVIADKRIKVRKFYTEEFKNGESVYNALS